MRIRLLIALLLCQGLVHAADVDASGGQDASSGTVIYRTTDADGNVVFTDNPPADRHSEAVHLNPTNAVPMATPDRESGRSKAPDPAAPAAFSGYRSLSIVSPEDGATLRDPQKPVPVKVRLTPPLQPGDRMSLLDNGTALEGDTLDNPDRGSHTLQARVLGGDGQVRIESPTITVYVHQTSVGASGTDDDGDGDKSSGSGVAALGTAAKAGGAARAGKGAHSGGAASPGRAASPSRSTLVR